MAFVNINYCVWALSDFFCKQQTMHERRSQRGDVGLRAALEWLQKHITSVSDMSIFIFNALIQISLQLGADPDHVVLVGDSAGAGSIALHLVAFGGAPTKLFAEHSGFLLSSPRTGMAV